MSKYFLEVFDKVMSWHFQSQYENNMKILRKIVKNNFYVSIVILWKCPCLRKIMIINNFAIHRSKKLIVSIWMMTISNQIYISYTSLDLAWAKIWIKRANVYLSSEIFSFSFNLISNCEFFIHSLRYANNFLSIAIMSSFTVNH